MNRGFTIFWDKRPKISDSSQIMAYDQILHIKEYNFIPTQPIRKETTKMRNWNENFQLTEKRSKIREQRI